MSLFTRSRQLLHKDAATTEGDPAPTAGDAAADAPTDAGEEGVAADPEPAADADAADPEGAPAGGRKRPGFARARSSTTTVLAALLVFAALVVPNELTRVTPASFTRIPVEAIFGAALLLVLPTRARRVTAVIAGVCLGLVTILNLLDMGFYSVLDRPFDLVLDWILFDDAKAFLQDSVGTAGAIGAVIVVIAVVLAVLVLITLAVVRLTRLVAEHSAVATRSVLVAGTVWVACMALGVRYVGVPVASLATADLAKHRLYTVRAGIEDEREFAKVAAVDRFADTPADQLLTGLRGKDVIFAFIESYGRSAIEDPAMAPQMNEALAEGTDRLKAAGFSARSGFLTSPTFGGGSWLAHSTFMSGLWVKNQQRYRSVTSSDHLSLTGAFQRSDAWRTVGIMPGVTRSWPEGKFYGLDTVYDSRELGYEGPKFSWAPVPDQYSLSAFERLENSKPGRKPLMSEIILVSSHNPWAPIPKSIGWDEVGDGSVYQSISKDGKDPKEVWKDPDQVRTEYRRSIEYSVNSLVSYVAKYGDKDTVLVFLGDHQPAKIVTGENAGRDVPISIVAHDPAVLDKIAGWGWHEGLKPSPDAPVWPMDTFRDRFLTAYGPQPAAPATPPAR
ncbi:MULTISPECIES: sulfatase [Streptomyces]|uniref:Sulfatase n=1 Tax=Streptomyces achmelvichensis TaxID=3134111 RepID=A0ACC6Q0Z3_9ACTN|nr:sulfatase [Streptomyces sp. NBC_01167]